MGFVSNKKRDLAESVNSVESTSLAFTSSYRIGTCTFIGYFKVEFLLRGKMWLVMITLALPKECISR